MATTTPIKRSRPLGVSPGYRTAVAASPRDIGRLGTSVALRIAFETLFPWKKAAEPNRDAELYEIFYSLNWGEASLANYGFAPADGSHPERFQFQLYDELYTMLVSSRRLLPTIRLLEISCGRGGGLHHLIRDCNTELEAIGIDLSGRAIDFCCKVYVEHANLRFIQASALALPFPDAIFDVVVNVEAAHAYRDYTTFLSEAVRILRPGGTFLFADHCQSSKLHLLNQHLSMAGLAGELVDITANILQACVSDGDRRRRLFRSAIPWYLRPLVRRRFEDAAALQGSRFWGRFRSADHVYLMGRFTK